MRRDYGRLPDYMIRDLVGREARKWMEPNKRAISSQHHFKVVQTFKEEYCGFSFPVPSPKRAVLRSELTIDLIGLISVVRAGDSL